MGKPIITEDDVDGINENSDQILSIYTILMENSFIYRKFYGGEDFCPLLSLLLS